MTPESFAAARAYIMSHGRPVDRVRFAYHFEGGDSAPVLQALAAYQNDDGGFGHALEPDLRTPASSAIATSTGLAILREVKAAAGEPLVADAIRYLLYSYDAARDVWPIVPPAVEDAPHAPWWTYADSEASFDGFLVNPRAALVGHLYHFDPGQEMLAAVSRSLLAHMGTIPDDDMDMHDLLAFLELAEADNVPADLRQEVVSKLRRTVPHALASDPAQWTDYTLRPLQVAPAPDSILASEVDRAAVDANLDWEIERQSADGSWDLAWSWDFVDAAAWARAENDWKGYHAVNTLRTLAAYGRLAGS
ncbi:MAG: hypothetical protein JSW55_12465 [Chloroflexota bacterium]|nr:MAG: hypothetical protein JSW55_12465 [Chloroflexota bacterium]